MQRAIAMTLLPVQHVHTFNGWLMDFLQRMLDSFRSFEGTLAKAKF